MPCDFNNSAARALEASFGQLQYRMISRSRGIWLEALVRFSRERRTAPGIGGHSLSSVVRRSTMSRLSPATMRSRNSSGVIRATSSFFRNRCRGMNFPKDPPQQEARKQKQDAGAQALRITKGILDLVAEEIPDGQICTAPRHDSQAVQARNRTTPTPESPARGAATACRPGTNLSIRSVFNPYI